MIKKYTALYFFSCSLIAMEPTVEPYNPEHMMVFVGADRPYIPLSEVIQNFPKLANTLMQAGYISTKQNHYQWIFGTNNTIFPQDQKDALWDLNILRKNPLNFLFSNEKLWKVVYFRHQWQENTQLKDRQLKTDSTIINTLMSSESMYPKLPKENNWKNSHNIISIWEKQDKNPYYVITQPDGTLYWHNHTISDFCKCPDHIVLIPSFAVRYCQQYDTSSDQKAFTKEHVQQFCNNKIYKNITLDTNGKNLTITFKDNTQLTFARDNAQSTEWKSL